MFDGDGGGCVMYCVFCCGVVVVILYCDVWCLMM